MTKRLTAQERLDKEMQKLAAMGITISTSLAPGVDSDELRPAHLIEAAAKRAGISYTKGNN
jgi:hypothetical protein